MSPVLPQQLASMARFVLNWVYVGLLFDVGYVWGVMEILGWHAGLEHVKLYCLLVVFFFFLGKALEHSALSCRQYLDIADDLVDGD